MIIHDRVNKEKYPKIYWLLIILVVCFSQDTLLFGTNGNTVYISIAKIVPFIIIGIVALNKKITIWNRKNFCLVFITCMLPMISCFANGESINNYVYRLVIMVSAALIVMFFDMKIIFELFQKLMVFLSVWSIGTFVLSLLVPNVVKMLPIITNTRGYLYYNAIFSVISFDGTIRNHSIFREPGMFMVMLIIAILIELLIDEEVNMKRIVIYTLAVLSTVSTAGYIILALVYIYIVLMDKRLDVKYKLTLVLFILVVVGALIKYTDLLTMESSMFSKFQKGSNSYGSWFARLSSITKNLEIALNNPLFGVGRYTLYSTILASEGIYVVADNTNTLMINFAAYGIVYGCLCAYGVYSFVKKYSKSVLVSCFIFILLFLAFSNEDMGQNIIFYLLMFDGLLVSGKSDFLHSNGN